MNISETDVEKAVHYLASSAKEYAYWKGRVIATEYLIKIAEAKSFLDVDNGTQEYKKSMARSSTEYKKAVEDYEEAMIKYTELQSFRKSAEMKISVYQSSVKANAQGLHL